MEGLAAAAARSSAAAEELIPICAGSNSGCRLQDVAECADNVCKGKLTVLIFPFLALSIGAVAQPLSRMLKAPYTLALLCSGIVLGLLGCGVDLGLLTVSLQQWVHLNPPQIFFFVFLAPLIFEAAFNTQLHVFKRVLVPVLTLAFVVVLLQLGLIAAFQRLVVRTDEWTWWAALMFGSMLSATDPISVTATLKSVGASETLNTLIEGESLLNDGSAFVLWEAFFENTVDPEAKTVGEIVVDIFRLSLGGAVMGVGFGLLALLVLSFVYDEFEVETSITVVVAFLGFWTAQAPSRLSGVICNVASGLFISALGRPLISPAVRGPLAEFWELLSWIANTIVFVHAGVLVSAFTWSCSGDPHGVGDYFWILGYFAFLQVIRFGLLGVFMPVLRIQNKWLGWKEATVVGASGLRGAVSLVLALEVGSNAAVPEGVRSRVVLWTTGIVFLSLVVNGLAVKPILHALKLDKADKTREDFLRRARSLVVQRTLMILDTLAIEGSLKQARWSYVAENVLPSEWINEDNEEHTVGYAEAVEHFGPSTVGTRTSIDMVAVEGMRHVKFAELGRRLSADGTPSAMSHPATPRRRSLSPGGTLPRSPSLGSRTLRISKSPGDDSIAYPPRPEDNSGTSGEGADGETTGDELGAHFDAALGNRAATGASTAFSTGRTSITQRASTEAPFASHRMSMDFDVQRYGPHAARDSLEAPRASTELMIHREIAALHHANSEGHPLPAYTERDREVLRRMLTSMLSKVRALANATLSEFAVLVGLDEDIQRALDANEAGKTVDMYDFLDRRGLNQSKWYHRWLRLVSERQTSRGETSITTAHVLIIVLTHVLKEDFMQDSAVVYYQAESLYEGAATLLNRLESLNKQAVEWVESQFAVHFTSGKQDAVLEEMLAHGSLDDYEYKVLHEELVDVRRRHFLWTSRRRHLPPKLPPRELLKAHDVLRGLPAERRLQVCNSVGTMHELKGGQLLQCAPGDLVIVLKGALRPVLGSRIPDGAAPGYDSTSGDDDVGHALERRLTSRDGTQDLVFTSGSTMHWCFPAHNAVVGPDIALLIANTSTGTPCAVARANILADAENRLRCVDVSGQAVVWTLPMHEVRALARANAVFRTEITRSLARQMVLESIADMPPYALSHVQEALSGVPDENTVIGRASKLLERLPYMDIITLHRGARAATPVHGPGVLLNGTVRVSIVDTSGLVGAVNLLHEELTGPALLPAGGLLIEDVAGSDAAARSDASADPVATPTPEGDARFAALAAEASLLAASDSDGVSVDLGPAYAHVLIEQVEDEQQLQKVAALRLRRWATAGKGGAARVDQNGRHAIIRHVSLTHSAFVGKADDMRPETLRDEGDSA